MRAGLHVWQVRCKDGFIEVSAKAIAWMKANFPPDVAASVPCATLRTTLQAEGLLQTDGDTPVTTPAATPASAKAPKGLCGS